MKLLFLAALVLSAAAARPDSWRPWQDEKFPPARGPKQDEDTKCANDKPSVTESPEDGEGGSGGDMPEWESGQPLWTDETSTQMDDGGWNPNRPTALPGNGNPQGPVRGDDRNDHQRGRPQVSPRGKRQLGRRFWKPKGPPRGRWPSRENPGSPEFSMVFKVDNVTFQNVTDVTLKEGENVFLMPKFGGRGHHHHHKRGRHGPPNMGLYVKLIYNATEPNTVSIEYGVLKPMSIDKMVEEEDNPEEDF